MRNINENNSLSNGTRLILKEAMDSTLKCYNPVWNEMAFIPRRELRSDMLKREGFMEKKTVSSPTCISMSINKSQGQTIIGKFGVYLYRSVFSHRHLNLALSRSTKQENVKIALTKTGKTANIVLKQAMK